jgi:CBS domain containing-hemolysin-like protein
MMLYFHPLLMTGRALACKQEHRSDEYRAVADPVQRNAGDVGDRRGRFSQGAPSTCLSTMQVGITTAGILSGAISQGGFTLTGPYASDIALTIVVAGLTYSSVVVGELVPKQLGLLAPEKIASFIAPPMNILARVAFLWSGFFRHLPAFCYARQVRFAGRGRCSPT